MAVSYELSPECLQAVAFVGDTLSPFFLDDPATGAADALYSAFAQLDARQAAQEWPFGDVAEVARGVELMAAGLVGGVDDALVWEYRRLFVGPGHKAAAPWGSVYTDHDGVIFGESALALSRWMAQCGIERLAQDGEPDDHLGLMLKLMAWIALNRPELLRDYLQLHFLTWSSHYLRRLEVASEHPFYRGLALLTRTSLTGIQEELDLQVQLLRFYR